MKIIKAQKCWQYSIRQKNLEQDLKNAGISHDEMKSLRIKHFKFIYVPKKDRKMCQKIKEFILRHEWLGKMPNLPTHRFIAIYKGHIAAAIIMSVPNAFCKRFGVENIHREKLISRGACISWSPKNLASALIMFSIRWMAQNTSFCFFTAYSDPMAGEIGTIYQACNFIYLGQNSGNRHQYLDPDNPVRGWFGERNFRNTSQIKQYAKDCGIKWNKRWSSRDKIYWTKMAGHIVYAIKSRLKSKIKQCRRRKIPKKHKYVYILDKNKKETKKMQKLFFNLNPKISNLPYPSRT